MTRATTQPSSGWVWTSLSWRTTLLTTFQYLANCPTFCSLYDITVIDMVDLLFLARLIGSRSMAFYWKQFKSLSISTLSSPRRTFLRMATGSWMVLVAVISFPFSSSSSSEFDLQLIEGTCLAVWLVMMKYFWFLGSCRVQCSMWPISTGVSFRIGRSLTIFRK